MKVGICKVEQRWINVVYLDVNLNNVKLSEQCCEYEWPFVKKTKNKLWAKNIIIFLSFKKKKKIQIEYSELKFPSLYIPFQGKNVEEYVLVKSKFLW